MNTEVEAPIAGVNGSNGRFVLNALVEQESKRQLATSGAASQPLFSTADLEQINFRRFNPYNALTAVALSSALDAYEAGEIMTAARFWARIAKSDPTIVTVKPKREEAVYLKPIGTRPKDESPLAADQAAVLKNFYDNVRATHATKRHVVGKSSKLIQQMMEAIAFEYAAHHIIWEPNSEQVFTLPSGRKVPTLSATFEYVPLEFFEARTGALRFLGINNFYNGAPLEQLGDWVITTGPGLMFCACILHYFKRLFRHDGVNFSEKFGQPGTLVHTTAQQNSPEGKAALELAQKLASNYRGVIYGAAENKAEYIWPSGGASGEGLVMHVLGLDIKQELISMWMGADLSTMSRGGGKGAGQPVIGASVQGEEEETKHKADGKLISDTLNVSVDPLVLRWYFGTNTPILAESFIDFPEVEDSNDLRASVTMVVNGGGEVPIAPIAERLNVPLAKDAKEKVFQKMVPAGPGDGSAADTTERQPAVNARRSRSGDTDLENFLGRSRDEYLRAFANDLQPLRAAMEAVMQENDGVAFNTKVTWLRSQLPSLLKEINASPKSADALANVIRGAFSRGFKRSAQRRSSIAEIASTAH